MAAQGQAPEVSVSKDIIRRGLISAPIIMFVNGVIWGLTGAWSAGIGLALVLLNFGLAALLISWAAPISLALMMGVSLFGYLLRLGLISLAVFLVRDASWISLPALGVTIIVSHLGLLFWEMRFIAASLAFPGLRPNA
ncbi:MAG: ATP synthase subunit I [Actinobacteria bacterium]|nr:ATP synthase subunit I [Actinomycetota bacterium]